MEIITRDEAGIMQLRLAWQKARSTAAESGYLDLLDHSDGIKGLDWAVGNEKTLDMLLSYETAERPLDDNNWMNLCILVNMSAAWSAVLATRGYEMPEAF